LIPGSSTKGPTSAALLEFGSPLKRAGNDS
jgi:hypothetical protein